LYMPEVAAIVHRYIPILLAVPAKKSIDS